MPHKGAGDRKCNRSQSHDGTVRYEAGSEASHQRSRKKVSVKSPANDTDDSTHALAKRSVIGIGESACEHADVDLDDQDDREDRREFREESVAHRAKPAIFPLRNLRARQLLSTLIPSYRGPHVGPLRLGIIIGNVRTSDIQRGREIRNQVVGVLDSDRQTQQRLVDPRCCPRGLIH